MAKRIAVFLAEGFEEIEAVTPVDLWRRAGVEVVIVGLVSDTVTGSHGIALRADAVFTDVKDETFDALYLPGGPGAKPLADHEGLGVMIRMQESAGRLLCAICAAPATVLAPLGLTNGKTVTGFPGTEDGFQESTMYTSRGAETDGKLVTGKAAGKAADFAHAVLVALGEREAADEAVRRTYFDLES